MTRKAKCLGGLLMLFAVSAWGAEQKQPKPITPSDATVVKMGEPFRPGWRHRASPAAARSPARA